ncbi:MAG: endolytic transglycosylase MltG [Desulfobacterales bacterium]|nr:endolytic transglycosylase MltG [Desulfobacterales bacterium]
MKKYLIFTSIIISMFLILLVFLYAKLYSYANTPADNRNIPTHVVVKSGQPFATTLKKLYNKKLIVNPRLFKIYAKLYSYESKIKAGEYLLSPNMPPEKILSVMVSGKVRLYKLIVPEGYNIYQIGELVEESGFAIKNEFVRVAKDKFFLKSKNIDADSFEGYLFPDTYHFSKSADSRKIISKMVSKFNLVFNNGWEKRAKEIGFTKHQVVILASIIEKETGAAFERPLISSVFHNRLKKRMRLETDPTVIYGIKDFDGNIKKKHLRQYTPYNTYKIKGLPHGPISNPGSKSIYATLFPANTKFLYFVSKKDTTHKFSTNIKDHNSAVRKYQLRRRKR